MTNVCTPFLPQDQFSKRANSGDKIAAIADVTTDLCELGPMLVNEHLANFDVAAGRSPMLLSINLCGKAESAQTASQSDL